MTSSTHISPLGPVDPASIPDAENEKSAPWIVRKLVGSMTGRIVMSSWETLRASGTSVVCLSPWGDSSPLLLPCIRFRDLAVHTVIAATGGMAAVASPVMGPVSDAIVTSFGDTLLVKIGMYVGFDLATKVANDLVFDKPLNAMIPIHSKRLETTSVKTMLITLKYKHILEDASLGFFRSSIHTDVSLISDVLDYFSTEKGWFSPYLFASGRRPIIPRTMKPDIVFCHGPFLEGESHDFQKFLIQRLFSGDYRVGQTLLNESASVIELCAAPPPEEPETLSSSFNLSLPTKADLPNLSSIFSRSRTPSPEPSLTPLPIPPTPRRLVLVVVGLKPHRAGLWTTSARPAESVMHYQLLNGCPAVVVPVKVGAPLLAWDTLTLEELWKIPLPLEGESAAGTQFEGIVTVFYEFLDLCVDWDRVTLSNLNQEEGSEEAAAKTHVGEGEEDGLHVKKKILRDTLDALVASAIRSGESKQAKDEIDETRGGIAMWRIP
ncbi:unnamed protein product [Somion occarium]|uniref:Uncharacterized protein n=1 Tax=Somion occarium TaxID=3059160 RepID=A0ABP1DQ43_9APHY